MTPEDRLLAAAKEAVSVLNKIARGEYYGPSQDIQAGRALYDAVIAVETERAQAAAEREYQDLRRG